MSRSIMPLVRAAYVKLGGFAAPKQVATPSHVALAISRSALARVSLRFAMLILVVAAADAPSIQIDQPWARASAGGAKNGAAYLTITANGASDRLVGVDTPVAEKTELHESTMEMGAMKMRPVMGLALETGKPVTLMPGGYHVMLLGLKAPLTEGTTFPLTLRFEHAAPVTTMVVVRPIGSSMHHSMQ